jgi:hypothetical protein
MFSNIAMPVFYFRETSGAILRKLYPPDYPMKQKIILEHCQEEVVIVSPGRIVMETCQQHAWFRSLTLLGVAKGRQIRTVTTDWMLL